jgi:hypothetical protein
MATSAEWRSRSGTECLSGIETWKMATSVLVCAVKQHEQHCAEQEDRETVGLLLSRRQACKLKGKMMCKETVKHTRKGTTSIWQLSRVLSQDISHALKNSKLLLMVFFLASSTK